MEDRDVTERECLLLFICIIDAPANILFYIYLYYYLIYLHSHYIMKQTDITAFINYDYIEERIKSLFTRPIFSFHFFFYLTWTHHLLFQ